MTPILLQSILITIVALGLSNLIVAVRLWRIEKHLWGTSHD